MDSADEFWSFSNQLRLETAAISALSLGDTICSDPFGRRRPEDRRNSDVPDGAFLPTDLFKQPFLPVAGRSLAFANNTPSTRRSNDQDTGKNYFTKTIGKTNNSCGGGKKSSRSGVGRGGGGAVAERKFKTLPEGESLPRREAVGGYIFVCNNDTMQENLRRHLFGLPPRYRDSVRGITPGLPLFLYNYTTHQMYGVFEAASFGGSNIDPTAWDDKKCVGQSRFPAQVRVATRKLYPPLEENSFRPILHHYDGPKFRLELSVPEALELLDIFERNCV